MSTRLHAFVLCTAATLIGLHFEAARQAWDGASGTAAVARGTLPAAHLPATWPADAEPGMALYLLRFALIGVSAPLR